MDKIKEIYEANKNLLNNLESSSWEVSYNRSADMLFIGGSFPLGSFYVPLGETRVLLRVDKALKLYGLAIENAEFFLKENPQFALVFLKYMHPLQYKILHATARIIFAMRSLLKENILSVTQDFTKARMA